MIVDIDVDVDVDVDIDVNVDVVKIYRKLDHPFNEFTKSLLISLWIDKYLRNHSVVTILSAEEGKDN